MSEYTTEYTESVNLDGDVVEVTKTRWATAVELMGKREPDVDWSHVSDVVRMASAHVSDGKVVCMDSWAKAHVDEIRSLKPQIIAIDAAEKEIAKARYASNMAARESERQWAKHESFASQWENGQLR